MWGWVPVQSVGLGPLAFNWREDHRRYFAPWSTRLPSTAHNMCGSVPLLIQISGAGSPFTLWGLVPFYCVGLHPPSDLRG